jgi:hypothetical protein
MSGGLTRRGALAVGATAVAGTALAATLGRFRPAPPPELATSMTAVRRDDGVPLDPADSAWSSVPGILVALSPQQAAPPILQEAAVDTLTVRAAHDGRELAFQLAWDDPDLDDLDGIGVFHDAVALQLPVAAGGQAPPITMGAPGAAVHILQWRGSWQRDMDAGRAGTEALYPHLVRDVTPDDILPPEAAVAYRPGLAVGNQLSAEARTSPVEELVAEGFGSATSLENGASRGAGVHEDGGWRVTIALPLDRGEAGAPIEPGSTWPVAFAVWLGSRDNRGGRKHFADWVQCDVESA